MTKTEKIILQRLAALEAALKVAPSRARQQLTKSEVAHRYAETERSVDRRRERAKRGESRFPLPVLDENGRPKWWLDELEAYERTATRDAS
jgi:hypothetical protein